MSTEVVVPALGESVTEATVAGWLKANGDIVAQDEPIVELETDKVTVEVNSPTAGVLDFANFEVGETVDIGCLVLCAVATHPVAAHIVDHDEDDVGRWWFLWALSKHGKVKAKKTNKDHVEHGR